MKKLSISILLCFSILQAAAQQWSVHLGAGLTMGKLAPAAASTAHTRTLRYGFMVPSAFLSTGIHFAPSENAEADFSYQLTDLRMGVRHKAPNSSYADAEYDYLHTDQFSIGLLLHKFAVNEKLHIGAFARMGLAHFTINGFGSSSGSSVGLYVKRNTGYEAITGKWTPISTLGFIIGPNLLSRKLKDKIIFTCSATIAWKDIYNDYTRYDYTFANSSYYESGSVQFRGRPLMLQFGIDYRLARFGKKEYY